MNNQTNLLFYRVIFHAILVLSIGLLAGLMLAFSLLDAVICGPYPFGTSAYRALIAAGLLPMSAAFLMASC